MFIKIDSKEYEKEKMELLDSIDCFSWQEFDYFTENLYKTLDDEYILETSYRLNRQYHEDEIKNGTLSEDDFAPKTEYRIMSTNEAEAWLEDALWEV